MKSTTHVLRCSLCLLLVGSCLSPPPNVLVTVADDMQVAGAATALTYEFEGEAGTSRIPLEGKRFPATFVLEGTKDETVFLWVYARDAADEAIARGRAKAIFRQDGASTARVMLTAVCAWGHAAETACTLDDSGGTLGVCREGQCVVAVRDEDGDGVDDLDDACPIGETDWVSDATTDVDGDGCRDLTEDLDDDDDGLLDANDYCTPESLPGAATGWRSDVATDFDGDGCQDATEDTDDDNDGVDDLEDDEPTNPSRCGDADFDGCDDCSRGLDGLGPGSDSRPYDDGFDTDLDGICDVGDSCPFTPDADQEPLADPTRIYANACEGGGIFRPAQEVVGLGGRYVLLPWDVDGDGAMEILAPVREGGVRDGLVALDYEADPTTGERTWVQKALSPNNLQPLDVRPGDFDEDGDLDLLITRTVAGTDGAEVIWVPYDAGTWVWPRTWPEALRIDAEVHAQWVGAWRAAVGDVDGVNGDDVAVAWTTHREVRLYVNDGGGTSWTTIILADDPYGAALSDVVAADFDGDLDVDFAVSWSGATPSIVWYDNEDGDGTTWTPRELTQSSPTNALAVLDLDDDGDLDLVSQGGGGVLVWYENPLVGGGDPKEGSQWSPRTISDTSHSWGYFDFADLDQDGDLDLLDITGDSEAAARISWYRNEGLSSSWRADSVSGMGLFPTRMALLDVDGDGDQDAATISWFDTPIRWLENVTPHRSSPFARTIALKWGDSWTEMIRVADLDDDDDVDFIVSHRSKGTIFLWENDGGRLPSFTQRVLVGDPDGSGPEKSPVIRPRGIDLRDVDNDGDLDLLSVGGESANIQWHENVPGTYQSQWPLHSIASSIGGWPTDIMGAYVNDDAWIDAVTVHVNDATIRYHQHAYDSVTGTHSWTSSVVGTENGKGGTLWSVWVADLDEDDKPDILTAAAGGDPLGDTLVWYRNQLGETEPWPRTVLNADAVVTDDVCTADLDGDGRQDVIASHATPDAPGSPTRVYEITVYINRLYDTTTPRWDMHAATDTAAYVVDTVDFDGDGDIDILAGAKNNEVIWLENDGSGTGWTKHLVAEKLSTPSAVGAGDLDGDGDTDVVSGQGFGNQVSWHPNEAMHFAVYPWNIAPAEAVEGTRVVLFQSWFTYYAREGEMNAVMGSFPLAFDDGNGLPLSSAELEGMVSELTLWRDTGSALFEPGLDLLLSSTSSFALDETGTLRLVSNFDPSVAQVAPGESALLFVVATLTPDGSTAAVSSFRATLLNDTPPGVRAYEAMTGTGLTPALIPDEVGTTVTITQRP